MEIIMKNKNKSVSLLLLSLLYCSLANAEEFKATIFPYNGTNQEFVKNLDGKMPDESYEAKIITPSKPVSFPVIFANCKNVEEFCNIHSKIEIMGPKFSKPWVIQNTKVWTTETPPNTYFTAKKTVHWTPPEDAAPGVYNIKATIIDENSGKKVKIEKKLELKITEEQKALQ